MGAANFFVVKDGVIYTPSLSGTILPGITRDSVIQLARERGYKVVEGRIPIDLIMTADEAFCTGTAAVISPIGLLTNLQLLPSKVSLAQGIILRVAKKYLPEAIYEKLAGEHNVPLLLSRLILSGLIKYLPETVYNRLLREYTTVYNNNQIGPVTAELLEALTAIKEGRVEDTHGWVEVVVPARKKEEKPV